MFSRSIYFVSCYQYFYIQIIVHCMDRPHFVHSWDNGHLCCFHFSLIVNYADMNIWTHIFVWAYIFLYLLRVYLGVELLGSMVTLCLTFFDELPDYFPKWLHHFIIWIVWGFQLGSFLKGQTVLPWWVAKTLFLRGKGGCAWSLCVICRLKSLYGSDYHLRSPKSSQQLNGKLT